jgi:hypothetical protein
MEIKIEDSSENFITWAERPYLSEDLRKSVLESDILIVPVENFRNLEEPVFPQRTGEVFNFLKDNSPPEVHIEVCVEEEDYKELALYDDSINIGYFVLTNVVLTVFLNILSNYIFKKVFDKERKQEIKFTFTVVDEKVSKTITFEGDVKDFLSSTEEIKKLCLEKPNALSLSENISKTLKPKAKEIVKKQRKSKRN